MATFPFSRALLPAPGPGIGGQNFSEFWLELASILPCENVLKLREINKPTRDFIERNIPSIYRRMRNVNPKLPDIDLPQDDPKYNLAMFEQLCGIEKESWKLAQDPVFELLGTATTRPMQLPKGYLRSYDSHPFPDSSDSSDSSDDEFEKNEFKDAEPLYESSRSGRRAKEITDHVQRTAWFLRSRRQLNGRPITPDSPREVGNIISQFFYYTALGMVPVMAHALAVADIAEFPPEAIKCAHHLILLRGGFDWSGYGLSVDYRGLTPVHDGTDEVALSHNLDIEDIGRFIRRGPIACQALIDFFGEWYRAGEDRNIAGSQRFPRDVRVPNLELSELRTIYSFLEIEQTPWTPDTSVKFPDDIEAQIRGGELYQGVTVTSPYQRAGLDYYTPGEITEKGMADAAYYLDPRRLVRTLDAMRNHYPYLQDHSSEVADDIAEMERDDALVEARRERLTQGATVGATILLAVKYVLSPP